MNNKGFTLIELLGSIVILAIIATVAFPAILNFLSSSQTNIDNAKKSVIERAAKDYVTDNKNKYKRAAGLNEKIMTQELIDYGYITNKDIIDSENVKQTCIIVGINDSNNYTFTFEENDCN